MAVTHEIKVVELAKLVPYEKNPNVHPIEQIKAIAESIERYGQYYPIIVDENLHILCGHGKKLALEHLGRTECEVKILHGLTEKQKLKIVIEDNKIPVVIVSHENATDDMAGTVTFNRARGTHLLEPMENIVKKLLDEGLSVDEISKKIGMSREEIFRLSKIDRETFLKLMVQRGPQKFSNAQVLRRG